MTFPGTVLAFPVLWCQYACAYCTNNWGDHSGTMPAKLSYPLETNERWMRFFGDLECDRLEILGGEPTQHKGFNAMVNAVKDRIPVMVGTNAHDFAVSAFFHVTPRPNIRIQASFHPTQTSIQKFTTNIKKLQGYGFNVHVHTVGSWDPQDRDYLIQETKIEPSSHGFISNETGWVFMDHPACKPKEAPKTVRCPVASWRCIAPNGDIYACHALMYARKRAGILGNVFEGWLADVDEISCPYFGWCNPCDIGRFLDPENTLRHVRLRSTLGRPLPVG